MGEDGMTDKTKPAMTDKTCRYPAALTSCQSSPPPITSSPSIDQRFPANKVYEQSQKKKRIIRFCHAIWGESGNSKGSRVAVAYGMYKLLVRKVAHYRRSDTVVGAWRCDVVKEAACVFSKITPHPAATNRSIDSPLYLAFYFFSPLMRLYWRVFVVGERPQGGLGKEKEITVRNRELQDMYSCTKSNQRWNTQQAVSKSSVVCRTPRGLRVALGLVAEQKQTDGKW